MDLERFPFFLSLLLVQSVFAHVEPPTNLSLQCRNLNNIVEWSYGQFVPELKFRVNIGAIASIPNPNKVWVDPPNLQADLSFLDPCEEYRVTVAAVIGQNESEADVAIKFSYYKDSQTSQICVLDLPAVNVTAQEDGNVQVRFMHPWLLYHHKIPSGLRKNSRRKKSQDAQIKEPLPELKYDVEIINQPKGHQGFTCDKMVCEGNLKVDPPHEKPCLKITGEMKRMSIQPTQDYCAVPSVAPGDKTYIYIIVVVFLVLFVVALILYMVYKKKTKPASALPDSVKFPTCRDRLKQITLGTDPEAVLVPEVGATSPTPLLKTPVDTEQSTPAGNSTTENGFHLPIRMLADDEGMCDDVGGGNDNDEGVEEYMPGNNLEEEEYDPPSVPSGYEKRTKLVELAPDDEAEGYRGSRWD